MASTDAKPVPQKNVAFRVTFPILDADGDLVTGATGLDSEVSKDGGTFADCTNEATEIATSSGVYYLDLTSTEMNADTVAIIVKTSTSGAKTTTLVMYPQETGDIKVDVQSYGGAAGTFSGGRPEVNTTHFGGSALTQSGGRPEVNGTHIAGSAVSTSSAQIGVNVVNAGGTAWNSGAITANTFAAGAITAAKFAANALDAVWSTATRILTAGTNIVLAKGTGVTGFNDLDAAGVRGAVGMSSANLDTQLSGINSNVLTGIGYVDTEVAAIKAKTDQLTFTTANRVDAQVFGMQADTVTASALASDAVAEINATVDLALADYDAPTHAELVSEIDDVQADIAGLENLSAAQVNAEMVDVLSADTYAEPGQGAPGATISLAAKIGYLFKAWRNKTEQTDGQYSLYADDETTVDQKAMTTDDGTTFRRTEVTSG